METVKLKCSNCGNYYERPLWRYLDHKKRGDKNNFCSRVCSNSGRFNPSFKRGYTVNKGYRRGTVGNNKNKYFHIILVETKIGRKLEKGECAHHLDGDRNNNNLSNIVLCKNASEHIRKYHIKSGVRGFCKV